VVGVCGWSFYASLVYTVMTSSSRGIFDNGRERNEVRAEMRMKRAILWLAIASGLRHH